MISDDKRDFLKLQMQMLNEQFHATIAGDGAFEDVKSLYLQMKSLYQQANAAGLDIAPETPTEYRGVQASSNGITH